MKNRRALYFSAALAVASMFFAWLYVTGIEKEYGEKYKKVKVVAATKNIERYEIIDESMLQAMEVPLPYQQPKAVEVKEAGTLIGSVAGATILKGEQITWTKIAQGAESRISPRIEKDQRACTIAVNEVTGVAGLIRPWDHVDIIGTFKTLDQKDRSVSGVEATTLLQNVPVLAVGKNYAFEGVSEKKDKSINVNSESLGFSNVTLSVTPRQCMDLVLAQQIGSLSLSLRSFLNRYGGDTFADLKEKRSSMASVTGIQTPLEITRVPKYLELRGDKALWVP